MENQDINLITRDEIIRYVDILVKKHEFTYDKRLVPLIYEFFIRSAEKFHWDRETFLTKYINFSNETKIIQLKELKDDQGGISNNNKKAIYINRKYVERYKKEGKLDKIINTFNHESLHKTDLRRRNGRLISQGLYKVKDGKYISKIDVMLDEVTNESAAYIISSSELSKTIPIMLNIEGYKELSAAFSIMCASFDMLETEMGYLKDKGRDEFENYLKNKYPYIDIEKVLKCFTIGLNTIHETYEKDKKEDNVLNDNIISAACHVMYKRVMDEFSQNIYSEEFIERMSFDIYKMFFHLAFEGHKEYEEIKQLVQIFTLYKTFAYNIDLYTDEEREIIVQRAKEGKIEVGIINAKNLNSPKEEHNLKEIIDKYYELPQQPLNDNTQLVKQLEKNFAKPTIKERIEVILSKMRKRKALPMPNEIVEKSASSNVRDSVKVEELKPMEAKQEKQNGEEVDIEGEK